MQKENKKVIYYYYDKAGNRRPIDIQINDGHELMIQNHFIKSVIKENPNLDNNLYALVDGYEFKLS
ncbi:hypothetical protein PYH72_07965 [Staphylococcus delphini]|uniref:hypothetical protein n=1 Tax=Staphylococcus delphini TaxID=53344 RepID=UPI0021CFAC0D|nr:hypothetical protein [Staphylococcus delphini]UXS58515.1 hypothetical protein MUA44_05055 [Staphylococcus delphini]UXV45949.1 hypothetical protein MUA63_05560 [Staphylococcus delphini]